ncbi:MAG: hypothetical protein JW861_07325 [Bacteroidales bacterium]|nr:hypothetical protein [Bacteroidales bacterium]
MKKTILFILLLITATQFARGQSATVSIGDYTADPGLVNIAIDVTNFVDVAAITLFIEYDPNVISYVSYTSTVITNVYTNAYPWGSNYVLGISWAELTSINLSSGVLMELVFNYVGGTSALDFMESQCEIANSGGYVIPTVYTDGSIGPAAAVPIVIVDQLNQVPSPPNLLVPIEVDFSGVPDGVGSFNFEIEYDDAILLFQQILNPFEPGIAVNQLTNPPRIALAWNTSNPLSGSYLNGKLLDMEFEYLGGNTELTFITSACQVANFNAQVLNATYENGLITQDPATLTNIIIDSIGAAAGETINLPVTVTNFTNVGSFDYSIGFNSQFLAFVDVVNIHPSIQSGLIYNVLTDNLILAWNAVMSGVTLPDHTTLFEMQFNYSGTNQDVPFILPYCSMSDFDANPINAYYIDGKVTEIPGANATVCMTTVVAQIQTEVLMPITVTEFNNIGAITLEMTFNESDLTYIALENLHPELGNGSHLYNCVNGLFSFSWTVDVAFGTGIDIPDNETLFEIRFLFKTDPADVLFNTQNCEVANYNALALNVFYCDGQVVSGIEVAVKAFLDGPFSVTGMHNILYLSGDIPLSQPYNQPPWNYTGTESVAAFPNNNVVDWVLIELRDTTQAGLAVPACIRARQAAFLLKDGHVVGMDGISPLRFPISINHNLYVVVRHRNHLAVMANYPATLVGNTYFYDFTTGFGVVYGGNNGHKEVGPGIWGMIGGDGDANDEVNTGDKNDIWSMQAGYSGYLAGDFNMDWDVDNGDKNEIWRVNAGRGSQVPE